MSSSCRSVAITGMGIVCSIGHNTMEFGNSLRSGKSGIGFSCYDKSQFPLDVGAYINDFNFLRHVGCFTDAAKELSQRAVQCARRSPFAVQVSAAAALEAWIAGELIEKPVDGERIGIIAAGSNISQNHHYRMGLKYKESPDYINPSYAVQYNDFDHIGTLSEIFGINGEGFTAGGASASGNVGIIKGFQMVEHGLVDVCVVIGSLADLSPVEMQSFINLDAMGGKRFKEQPEKACRPFDAEHEGFIYGQAGACLILESMNSAERRGIVPYAEILGGSIVLDGNRLSNPNKSGEMRAMEYALEKSGIERNQISYINTHGTSTPMGDRVELEAIRDVFGSSLSTIWINSTKGLTGHCLYSAGVVEAIASVIQMKEGFLHPNINLDNPIAEGYRFSPRTRIMADLQYVMSNSFGFGGINTSIVLKRMGG